MFFDGMRALVKGDYVRPKSGEYKGRLGPWEFIFSKLNIDPMSDFGKGIFVFFGLTGLATALAFIINPMHYWKYLAVWNILSMWYLVFGTVVSLISLVLLYFMYLRK